MPPPPERVLHAVRVPVHDVHAQWAACLAASTRRMNAADLRLNLLDKWYPLGSPNEGSSIDHQVTIHLHAQNITMFSTNETWYFTSQMLVSSSGGPYPLLDGPTD
ncbi:70 kDa peptidyl-prolyl isomerase-like [Dorcoceras hygrometricum]|uniref:70 kDa peptidyl-prolyl isomerase-like n=1 Tax=Dorcoceras hygrometricum TaxID=472368 RepID=A0A2Z7B4Y9_9LAMI|nr:70 kDa peptidyl-prolyl isomerase-like [Dorcoceras hygrometricum]